MYQKGEIINAQGKKRGFALIELMIVIVIIAILGIIAIPAYQDYTIRAQISEGLTLASGAKPVVAEYYANHGVYPQGNSDVSYTGATGSYISSINIAKNGVILATLGNQANQLVQGKVIALTPSTISDETIDFEIQTPKLSFLDKLFGVRSAIAQASPDGWQCYSNVPKQYLATSCMSKTITVNGKDSNGNEVPIITTENQTVSCPTGQVGSIEQQRTVSTFRDGTPTAYGDWQTVTNSCAVPPPTVTTENQTVSCPTGQMGAIAQQRTVTTPYQGTPTYSDWTTTSNTCFVPPPTVTTESQTISCQAGYSGSITQQRTVTTPYQGTPTYSAWTTTNTSCVPLQQPAYTKTDLFTVGNVIYKNGYVYWGYLNTTTNPPTVVGTLLNKTSMDMDGTQHYQYGSYQITLSGNGVLNYGGLYGYSNVIGGGTYGQATPSYTSSGTTVSQTVYRLYASSSWPQYTNFYNAASNALTYPSASSFASYQTELQNFKNSIATVKAQNGGGYPANYPQILIDIANKVGA